MCPLVRPIPSPKASFRRASASTAPHSLSLRATRPRCGPLRTVRPRPARSTPPTRSSSQPLTTPTNLSTLTLTRFGTTTATRTASVPKSSSSLLTLPRALRFPRWILRRVKMATLGPTRGPACPGLTLRATSSPTLSPRKPCPKATVAPRPPFPMATPSPTPTFLKLWMLP